MNPFRKYTHIPQWLHHSLTWLCYWAIVIWLMSHSHDLLVAVKVSGMTILVQACIFYLNLNVLLPHLLYKKRFWSYFFSIITIIFCAFYIYKGIYWILDFRPGDVPETSPHRHDAPRPMKVAMTVVSSLSILFISTVYKFLRDARLQDKERIELKNQQLESEMKFLKSQINPHFLFNALNNIYTLAQLQSDKTPEVILKLSHMMRYMLYESNTNFVSIEKEIKYIENYISVHQLKEDGAMNIHFDYSQANLSLQIAPLILLPFFENSFKHGNLEDIDAGFSKAELRTTDDQIYFRIENSISQVSSTKDSVGGVGLSNVRRRLELLYPKKHKLETIQKENSFSVSLEITYKTQHDVQNSYCRRRAARSKTS